MLHKPNKELALPRRPRFPNSLYWFELNSTMEESLIGRISRIIHWRTEFPYISILHSRLKHNYLKHFTEFQEFSNDSDWNCPFHIGDPMEIQEGIFDQSFVG
jgi:hypothetical protein